MHVNCTLHDSGILHDSGESITQMQKCLAITGEAEACNAKARHADARKLRQLSDCHTADMEAVAYMIAEK